MAQSLARDEAGNVWELDAQGNVLGLHQAAPQAPQPVFSTPADPTIAPRVAKATADATTAEAQAPYAGALAAAQAQKEAAQARYADANAISQEAQGAAGAAKQRADAIAAYKAGNQLLAVAANLRGQYNDAIKNGGVDRWLRGVIGAYPTPENRTFNDTGNQARALIKQTLGFTGGEGNTATESQINYGPFIPQAGDYNEQIEHKIAALEDLGRRAQQRATAQLGGAPDENGHVAPATSAAPPSTPNGGDLGGQGGGVRYVVPGAGPNGGGGLRLSQSGMQAVPDPVGQATARHLNEMLKGGVSDADITNYAAKAGTIDLGTVADALKFRAQNPTYSGDYNFSGFDQKNLPMSLVHQALNAAAQSPVGTGVMNFANAATFNALDNLAPNPELARAGLAAASAQHPVAAGLGTIAGGTAMAGGLEAGIGGLAARYAPKLAGSAAARIADALYGASSGAGAGDDTNSRITAALLGGATGLAGGEAGRRITRALGGAVGGVRNAVVDELRTRNIPLTVGQALSQSGRIGGAIKGIEDRISGLPIVGDVVNARRREGLEGFRRSMLDEALEPIGKSVENATGDDAVSRAQKFLGGAYDDALSGVSLTPDNQFGQDLQAISARAAALPEPLRNVFNSTMQNRVAPMFTNGQMTGRNLQGAIQGLRKDAGSLTKRGEVQADLFKDLANDTEEALFGLAQRQAPGTVEGLTSANAANRRMSIVEDALSRASNNDGLATPSQLGMAIRSNANRFNGRHAFARGDAPMQDLQRAGQAVLPSKVPDSGTAGRIATLLLPGAVAGAGTGYTTGDTETGAATGIGVAALLALGGSKAGQRALTAALVDRPQTFRALGDWIGTQASKGGVLGVGASQDLLPGY